MFINSNDNMSSRGTPFLKWVGGKTQIIDNVMTYFPREMNNYHEPFLGGGSVLLALLSSDIHIKGNIYASDTNANLISLYIHVQNQPMKLIEILKILESEYSSCSELNGNRTPLTISQALSSKESYYYWIRSIYNSIRKTQSVLSSAIFLFLNKTCFRGIYRESKNGFNVPFGNYKNPFIFKEEQIKNISKLIKRVIFRVLSFEESLSAVNHGDFVYLDPPYAPVDESSFVGYTVDGFSIDKHALLFQTCQEFKRDGISFLMSNANVPLVREAFPHDNFSVNIITCRRAINSKKPNAQAEEVLIT